MIDDERREKKHTPIHILALHSAALSLQSARRARATWERVDDCKESGSECEGTVRSEETMSREPEVNGDSGEPRILAFIVVSVALCLFAPVTSSISRVVMSGVSDKGANDTRETRWRETRGRSFTTRGPLVGYISCRMPSAFGSGLLGFLHLPYPRFISRRSDNKHFISVNIKRERCKI